MTVKEWWNDSGKLTIILVVTYITVTLLAIVNYMMFGKFTMLLGNGAW